LLVKLRKCDSGLVQKLRVHQTRAVLFAGSNMALSSCNNWFPSCVYKLVMTMIILARTPWLLRPWKMHFFPPFYLPFMHYASCNDRFCFSVLPFRAQRGIHCLSFS